MAKKNGLGCGGWIFAILAFGFVGSLLFPSTESEPENPVETSTVQEQEVKTIEDSFFRDLDNETPGFFVSDNAALRYFKQYCEADLLGDAGQEDAVNRIMNSYCDTELAEIVGVQAPPEAPSDFSEAEFLRIAEEEYGIVTRTYDDGSTLTPMGMANAICDGDVSVMKSNLGANWGSSFQKFVVETLCPQKLP